MSTLVIIAALIVGFVVGLLGGGGSIMAVPSLIYLVGLAETTAIATSLLVVRATSAFATLSHARAGNVAWRAAIIFELFAMAGAFMGGRLARFVPGAMLIARVSLIMLVAGIMV